MTGCYSTQAIRDLENFYFDKQKILPYDLMQRAGSYAFQVLKAYFPAAQSIIIFCGSGNNGGDGYVLARLALQSDLQVHVYALKKASAPVAKQAERDFLQAGGKIMQWQGCIDKADLIVDALLGIGLARSLTGSYQQAVNAINQSAIPVLALDMPTGLMSDTGVALKPTVKATVTATFIGFKAGQFTADAKDYCGKLMLGDLQLTTPEQIAPIAHLLDEQIFFHLPARQHNSHKNQFGRVLLIGGNHSMPGACLLAARAALQCGAGLVKVATRKAHANLLALSRPELICHAVETQDELLVLLNEIDVIAIGPGLGQDDWSQMLLTTVRQSKLPLVIDADGLNLLAKNRGINNNWVLTPHPGEAARLLAKTTAEVQQDRYLSARALQQRYGGVVVLKGSGTLIQAKENLTICPLGNPAMATAGMGDVLTGMIAAFVGQGLELFIAASLAVYLHAKAADILADKQRYLFASDVITALGAMLHADEAKTLCAG